MRWIATVAWLAGLVGLMAGCTQQCYLHECDTAHYDQLMPADLSRNPQAALPPNFAELKKRPVPVTINDPEKREPQYLTLQQAIALALEHGTTGIQSVRLLGTIADDLLTPQQARQLEFAGDSIRVLALEPAVQGAAIEASLSRFDARWVSQMLWSNTDQQVNGQVSFNNGNRGSFETNLVKPLASGGLAGVSFSTIYQNLSQPPAGFTTVNPSYTSRVDLTFEQPLWQSFGTDINQLLNRIPGASPGSNLTGATQSFLANEPFQSQQGNSAGFGTDGILISRLRFDQTRADFERAVNYMILNVEAAYWNLYQAYINLYAADQGQRMSHAFWAKTQAQRQVGGGAGQQQFKPYFEDRARGQLELFTADRIQALNQVLEAERVLRTLLGLTPDDGHQLIPQDVPSLAPYNPDWYCALEEALNLRPELIALRQELKLRELDVELQKNFLKPDLRFVSRYGASGLGSSLSGDGTMVDSTTGQNVSSNALRNLASTHFTDWNLGLTLNVPLGYRYEHASVRRARLALAQAYWQLQTEENKAESYLLKTWRDIAANFEELKRRRAQREAFGKALEGPLELARVGTLAPGSEEVLQSQRDYVNALRQEAQAIYTYNISIAAFHFAKGTLLRHDNVSIEEGALPDCAHARAVDHEQERGLALLLRERPLPHSPLAPDQNCWGLPVLSGVTAPSIPGLQSGAAQLHDMSPPPAAPNAPVSANPAPGNSPAPKTGTPMLPEARSIPAAGPVPGSIPVPQPAPVGSTTWSTPSIIPANALVDAPPTTWATPAGSGGMPSPRTIYP